MDFICECVCIFRLCLCFFCLLLSNAVSPTGGELTFQLAGQNGFKYLTVGLTQEQSDGAFLVIDLVGGKSKSQSGKHEENVPYGML